MEEQTLPVRLVPIDPELNFYVRGHTLVIAFEDQIGPPEPDANGNPVKSYVHAQRTAVADQDGNCAVPMPPRERIRGPFKIEIRSPRGVSVYSESRNALPQEFRIQFTPEKPFDLVLRDDPALGRTMCLVGRVLDSNGKQPTSGIQVVIMIKELSAPAGDPFRPFAAAKTDASGYFAVKWPRTLFSEAQALLGIDQGVSIPIKLENQALPKRLLLVVDMPDKPIDPNNPAPASCGCSDTSQFDLMGIEQLGDGPCGQLVERARSGCIDFNRPDRAIDEFNFFKIVRTTDPDIRGLTIKEQPVASRAAIAHFEKAMKFSGVATEATVADHPERMSAFSAPPRINLNEELKSIPLATIAELSKDPDGFTIKGLAGSARRAAIEGFRDLINPYLWPPGRAPLSSRNSIDWDNEPTFYQAVTIAHGHILQYKQTWRSDGYSLGDLVYSLPLAPGQKKQIAVIDWERRERASRSETTLASESMNASLSRDRDINEVVRSAADESLRGGSEASTWAAGGGIGFALGPVVIGGGGGGGGASSSAWQDSSRALAASSSQQLRDRITQSAAAVRGLRSTVVQQAVQGEVMNVMTEVVANHNHCHAITVQYFEVLRHLLITQELVSVQECLFVPMAMSPFDPAKALRWREPLRLTLRNRLLAGGFEGLERETPGHDNSDLPAGRYSQETIRELDGELVIRFQISRPLDKPDDTYEPANWTWLPKLLPFINPQEFYNSFLKEQKLRDRVFLDRLGPNIANAISSALRMELHLTDGSVQSVDADFTLLSRFANDAPLSISIRLNSDPPVVSRERIKAVVIQLRNGVNPFDVASLLPGSSRIVVESATIRYRTDHIQRNMISDARVRNDLTGTDDVRIPTAPLHQSELRNPRVEFRNLANQLVRHLNEHIEYYHRAIWLRMDADRRFMLLDGIVAPNANGRSVAGVVENRLIGIMGNSLIFPVAPGFRLDPTYKQEGQQPVDLLNLYAPDYPMPPARVSLPTRGVFAEAVMGLCNSCEKIDDTRLWNWDQATTDEPTAIATVGTDPRGNPPPALTPTSFPAPIIAMQSAPAAPDPTGLAAVLQAIVKPDMFRDITGLEGNQRNALAALQKVMDTAQFFGGEAVKLEQQRVAGGAIDRNLQRIQQARQSGQITSEQAQQLANAALGNAVGGAPTPSPVDSGQKGADAALQAIEAQRAAGKIPDDVAKALNAKVLQGFIGKVLPSAGGPTGDSAKELLQEATKNGGTKKVEAESFRPDGSSAKVTLVRDGGPGPDTVPIAMEDYEALLGNARSFSQTSTAAIRVRKSHRSLTPTEWKQYLDAIRAMKSAPGSTATSSEYEDFVSVHDRAMSIPAPGWGAHTMGNDDGRNFLAWHREYLIKFEERLLAAGGIPIPYWDFYSEPNVPLLIDDQTEITAMGVTRNWVRASREAFPPKSSFKSLWREIVRGTLTFSQWQRRWEQDFHNVAHRHVGGTMNTMASPRDPIFWMVHSFVDKFWADLQALAPFIVGAKIDPTNTSDRLEPRGTTATSPFSRTVGELLKTTVLGYSYEELFRPILIDVQPSDGTVFV